MSYTALIFLTFCFGYLSTAQTVNQGSCPDTLNTTTSDPPVLNSPASTLVGNTFTVNWIWSLTKTRDQVPSYKFGSCAYGVPTTSVDASACSLNQSAAVSWSNLLASCGWAQLGTNAQGDVQYGGNMTINATETFQDQRNITQTRALTYSFSFVVSFPQDISVAATIQVFSPILVDKFVLAQYYTTSVSNGTVDFRSVVEFPWKIDLVNNTVNVGNATSGTTASVGPNPVFAGTITTTQGTFSTQNWEIVIKPGPDSCDLTDSYTVFGTLTCVLADQTLCPTLPGPPAVTFVFNINSQSFCPNANNDVQLTGTLSIYDDAGFTNPHTQFVLGTESYFQLDVASTAVTVQDIVIDTVTVKTDTSQVNAQGAPVQSLTIYTSPTWTTNAGLSATMLAPVAGAARQRFHFSLTADLLLIPQDTAVNVTITARANVTYLATPVAKKRSELFVFQVNTQLQSFGNVFGVTNNNAQSLFASFFLVVLALCFWA